MLMSWFNRRRWCLSSSSESKFALPPAFYSIQALNGLGEVYPHRDWRLSSLISSSTKMLITSGNTLMDKPRNNVYLFRQLGKLTHKIIILNLPTCWCLRQGKNLNFCVWLLILKYCSKILHTPCRSNKTYLSTHWPEATDLPLYWAMGVWEKFLGRGWPV